MWVYVDVLGFKEGMQARIQVGYGSKMCGGMHRAKVLGKKGGVEVGRAGKGTQGRVRVRGG